jgi:hypothetical protein
MLYVGDFVLFTPSENIVVCEPKFDKTYAIITYPILEEIIRLSKKDVFEFNKYATKIRVNNKN